MHNKPKFRLFKNISYALAGMQEMLRSERSFQIQISIVLIIACGLFFTPIDIISKWTLFASTWLILIAEAFNSAIERVVDLVTKEYHPLAGQAKDIGAFAVLLAFCLTVMIWGVVLYREIF